MHERLLDALAKRGALADPAAAEYLARSPDPVEALDRVFAKLGNTPLVLTMEDILSVQGARGPPTGLAPVVRSVVPAVIVAGVPPKLRALERAKDVAEDFSVLRDITGKSTCEGTLGDFSRYFANRLEAIGRLLRARRELVGAVDIARARRLTREVRFIGMVADVRTTRKGDRVLEVEDATDTAPVFIAQGTDLFRDPVLPDEVIGVVGRPTEKGLVIAEQIVRPDVPNGRTFPTVKEGISVAFVSDIHVGSRTFLGENWEAFTRWMNADDPVAKSVRYLVCAGDVVDGIGVYPRQEEELVIDDVYAQYEELARLLAAMPDHANVIVLPGNHDAVRPAEPQPALPQNVQKLFDSNTKFVGNPCAFTLHGVRILAYHGRSMDDFVYSLPGMSYARPIDTMREMLRRRHLAPVYGGKTPIAPEAEDILVIDEVPDVFVAGHVHAVGMDEYKGVKMINASAWQSQTVYQKMHNIEPTPARVPILNLRTGRGFIKEF